MTKLEAASAAFTIGGLASVFLAMYITHRNRKTEWDENERSGSLSEEQMHWMIVHIRDDIGAIQSLIMVTNGLLTA